MNLSKEIHVPGNKFDNITYKGGLQIRESAHASPGVIRFAPCPVPAVYKLLCLKMNLDSLRLGVI